MITIPGRKNFRSGESEMGKAKKADRETLSPGKQNGRRTGSHLKKSPMQSDVKFLFTELKTGLTFARLAVSVVSGNPARIERNKKNARRAYDTLLKFQIRTPLSKAEKAQFDVGLAQLRKQLRNWGESV